MPPTFDSNFRLIWIHDESGPSGIPAGFSRDNSGDDRALQGAVSGGIFGGGSGHHHNIPEHEHTSNTHHHWTFANSGNPIFGISQYDGPFSSIVAPHQYHIHYGGTTNAASITYNISDPGDVNIVSGIVSQHITAIIIKPDSELSSIPSGVVAFTDEPTPPDNFVIASGLGGYPDLNTLFVMGTAAGQNGGNICTASSGHIHETSGEHGHDPARHNHGTAICGLASSMNTANGVVLPGRLAARHHNVQIGRYTTSSTSEESIITDVSASGLEPAYTKLLGIQTTGTNDIPAGIIFGYVGTSGSLDTEWWEICNGSGTTIDLTDTQIKITTDYTTIGDTDSSTNYHTHESSHGHGTSGTHLHSTKVSLITTATPRNTNAPTSPTILASMPAHTHIWTCSVESGGAINAANLTTSSGDHRGPWYSMLWVRSKGVLTTPSSGSLDLYIRGYDDTSGNVSLFIDGHEPISGSVDLFVGGYIIASGDVSLYTCGHDKVPGDAVYHIYDDDDSSRFVAKYDVQAEVDTTLFYIENTGSENLGIDRVTGDIFWSEPANSGINKFDLSTSLTSNIVTSGEPDVLFIDGDNEHVYWIDDTDKAFVRSKMDGSDTEVLFSQAGTHYLTSFDVDVDNSKIYWIRNRFDITMAMIYRANLDGSSEEILTLEPDKFYNDICLDVDNGYIYFLTKSRKDIRRTDLEGHNEIVVATDLPTDTTKISIDSPYSKLYFSNTDSDPDSDIGYIDINTGNVHLISNYLSGQTPDISVVTNDHRLTSTDLFIEASEISSGSIPLYIAGRQSGTDNIPLFIHGYEPASGSTDLFVGGHVVSSGDIPLFIHGHEEASGSTTLFIGGVRAGQNTSGNIDLFIQGHEIASGNIDLFIGGYNTSSGDTTLFIGGYQSVSGDIPLFIYGHDNTSGDILLYINGHIIGSGDIPLFIGGHIMSSSDTTLFIGGDESASSNVDLYIYGRDNTSGSCDLFIHGHIGSSGDTTLFISGHEVVSGDISLVMTGSGIIPDSGMITLVINGYEPKESTACPILDPTATVQIPTSIIDIYQGRVDALLNQVGKNVTLQFDPIITDCPNCEFDPIRKRSSGHYVAGGPSPFEYGRRCPYCKGKGIIEEDAELCIKCLIAWNPTNVAKFGISVQKNAEIVKLKTLVDNAPDLQRAKIAIIDRQVIDLVKYKARLVRGPYPIGLREDRYCISFWRTI